MLVFQNLFLSVIFAILKINSKCCRNCAVLGAQGVIKTKNCNSLIAISLMQQFPIHHTSVEYEQNYLE